MTFVSIPSDPIWIQEVGMRDGLQSAGQFIETDDKVRLLNRLSLLGFAKIEVTSFVSPKAVPLLADAEEVLARIERHPGVQYVALIPNVRGLERALATNLDEVNVVMSVSETHNLANMRMRCDASLKQFAEVVLQAGELRVNGTLATAFGCPFSGPVDPTQVIAWTQRYLDIGIDSITIADTVGVATPGAIYAVCSDLRARYPDLQITLHLHNTRGLGIANAYAGIAAGIDRFDASLGGIGGCPYAPGATGNVCTEDLVHALSRDGFRCDVDLQGLVSVARELESILGHQFPGLVKESGPIERRHPIPESVTQLMSHTQPE